MRYSTFIFMNTFDTYLFIFKNNTTYITNMLPFDENYVKSKQLIYNKNNIIFKNIKRWYFLERLGLM